MPGRTRTAISQAPRNPPCRAPPQSVKGDGWGQAGVDTVANGGTFDISLLKYLGDGVRIIKCKGINIHISLIIVFRLAVLALKWFELDVMGVTIGEEKKVLPATINNVEVEGFNVKGDGWGQAGVDTVAKFTAPRLLTSALSS